MEEREKDQLLIKAKILIDEFEQLLSHQMEQLTKREDYEANILSKHYCELKNKCSKMSDKILFEKFPSLE